MDISFIFYFEIEGSRP